MENSISYWQHFLLQELEEKELSPKQQKIAGLAKPKNKIGPEDFKALRGGAEIEEGEDHEVSMAQNSLKSIVSAASQLMNKLGQDEKDIPAWIQDHITNAANFISQAADNYHEYGEEEKPEDSLTTIMEKIINESVEDTLKAVKTGVRVKMILDDGSTVTMERAGSNKSGEPTFKRVDKEGKLKGGASTVSASHIKSVKQIKK